MVGPCPPCFYFTLTTWSTAVRASHKRAVVETDTFLDRTHLANLRKLQNERVEMEGMRQRGMQPRESMGVRMETRE